MKVLVNITTYAGLSSGAEHYYAKVHEMESDESIYTIAKNRVIGKWDDFYRIIEDEKEANVLTIKDNNRKWPYKVGDETWRFNSPKQIREWIEKAYQTFLSDRIKIHELFHPYQLGCHLSRK